MHGQRGTVGIADDVDRFVTQRIVQVLHGQLHRCHHIFPTHTCKSCRRRTMTRDPQPEYRGTGRLQTLTQTAQAVRRIRHAVQQQYARTRGIGAQFETMIPVGWPAGGI